MRRLRVVPAPLPILRTEITARALSIRSALGAATVISKFVPCQTARASSCAEVTDWESNRIGKQTITKNNLQFIQAEKVRLTGVSGCLFSKVQASSFRVSRTNKIPKGCNVYSQRQLKILEL